MDGKKLWLPKNILVTGCEGQLGRCFKDRAYKLIDLYSPNIFYTDVKELDITDQKAVQEFVSKNKIDLIINCAAYTNVDRAEIEQDLCCKINYNGPKNLAMAIEKRKGKIIHISTDYVFDGKMLQAYREDDICRPQNKYGQTKLLGEQGVTESCEKHIILRTAWLYSEYGKNFVKTMLNLRKQQDHIDVIFDQVGSPTYAGDLANAIIEIILAGSDEYGIFHFTNEGAISWFDFTKGILECDSTDDYADLYDVNPITTEEYQKNHPSSTIRPLFSLLDKRKIKRAYGMEIPYWKESLKEVVQKIQYINN